MSASDDPNARHEEFVRLLNASHRQLLGYLVSLLGNRHDAEDVLQRTSLTLWRKFATFERGSSFPAWASTVAFYEARNFQRMGARSRLQFSDTLLEILGAERTQDIALTDARHEALEQCMAKLDEAGRRLVEAAYLEGSDIGLLAEQFGRARQTLYGEIVPSWSAAKSVRNSSRSKSAFIGPPPRPSAASRKGGKDITVNYATLTPLGAPEFRASFRGIHTVAEYHFNKLAPEVSPNQYAVTIASNMVEKRPLQKGGAIEMEISQFTKAVKNGRKNYYGTKVLYVVGQGIVPWEEKGERLDSAPLPEKAWLGGLTPLPYQYSNEPQDRFKQMAENIAPISAQPFVLGRRLHHTDFGSGKHSEPGNPIYEEQVGKLGPGFVAQSCVACHVNNGRALPPAVGVPMLQTVVKVGSDAKGTPYAESSFLPKPTAPPATRLPSPRARIIPSLNCATNASSPSPTYSCTTWAPASRITWAKPWRVAPNGARRRSGALASPQA